MVLGTRPTQQIAECLGLNEADRRRPRCATWWSSAPVRPGSPPRSTARRKAWTSWCSRRSAPGGQAGSSSKIENYLGFPTGISGDGAGRPRLRRRRRSSAAPVLIAREARRLDVRSQALRDRDRRRHADRGAHGDPRHRRAVPEAAAAGPVARYEGAGIYYGATPMEAQLCARQEVDRRGRRQLRGAGGRVPR